VSWCSEAQTAQVRQAMLPAAALDRKYDQRPGPRRIVYAKIPFTRATPSSENTDNSVYPHPRRLNSDKGQRRPDSERKLL
jgi:hypothetical protein